MKRAGNETVEFRAENQSLSRSTNPKLSHADHPKKKIRTSREKIITSQRLPELNKNRRIPKQEKASSLNFATPQSPVELTAIANAHNIYESFHYANKLSYIPIRIKRNLALKN